MRNDLSKNILFEKMLSILDDMKEHPERIDDNDRNILYDLYNKICKSMGISEHSKWVVNYVVEKWHSTIEKDSGVAPYEVVRAGQNIILDNGANEMLRLICGTGGTAFNAANARIYVGTDTTAESASQSGVIASGSNVASASMDSGFPTVSGRTATFRSSFSENVANFAWAEASIVNGSGSNAISMNRKVASMGTKNGGTWTLQITVSLVSA